MNQQFEATAIELSQDGGSALPVINYLTGAGKATETLGLVQQWAPRSVTVGADVRQPDDVARMVDSVMATFGRIDILVNSGSSGWERARSR